MAAPDSVRPSKFEELIVDEDDTFCVAFRKTFIELPILLYRFTKWMLSAVDEGDLSADFGAMVCNVECPESDDGDSTTIPAS